MFKVDVGFERAYSNNLPFITSEMITDFFASNTKYLSVESRGIKYDK